MDESANAPCAFCSIYTQSPSSAEVPADAVCTSCGEGVRRDRDREQHDTCRGALAADIGRAAEEVGWPCRVEPEGAEVGPKDAGDAEGGESGS